VKTCTEHATTARGCARCQTDTRISDAVARERERIVKALRIGWPCRLPGGDIYGPYEDALWMVADAIDKGEPADVDADVQRITGSTECDGACNYCGTLCGRRVTPRDPKGAK
jgi:hypothetical protein